jgi:hypothetical protein
MLTWIVAAGIPLLVALVIRWEQPSHLSPDGVYYQTMAHGDAVPMPYALRWLLPTLCKRRWQWEVALWVSVPLSGLGLIWITFSGVNAPTGRPCALLLPLLTACLWAGLPFLRVNVWLPVLTDLPSMTLSLLAASWLLAHPSPSLYMWSMVVLIATASGAMNEKGPIFAAAWTLNPLPLLGLIGSGWWRRRGAPKGETAWLQHPWREARTTHRGALLAWQVMLGPWGMVLPLALLGVERATPHQVCAAAISLALGYGMLLRSQDRARLFLWAAPAVIPLAVVGTPEWAIPLVCLIALFNPYRGV